MPIASAHRRKKKKKIPPAMGTATRFSSTAAAAEMAMMPIIANFFMPPQVRDITRLMVLAKAPYDMADRRVVSWILSLQISTTSWKNTRFITNKIKRGISRYKNLIKLSLG